MIEEPWIMNRPNSGEARPVAERRFSRQLENQRAALERSPRIQLE